MACLTTIDCVIPIVFVMNKYVQLIISNISLLTRFSTGDQMNHQQDQG